MFTVGFDDVAVVVDGVVVVVAAVVAVVAAVVAAVDVVADVDANCVADSAWHSNYFA